MTVDSPEFFSLELDGDQSNITELSELILISLCIYSFVKLHVCSLGELVKHDQNGLVFNTESELEQQLEVINKHYRSSVLYTLHGLHVNVLPIYFSLS